MNGLDKYELKSRAITEIEAKHAEHIQAVDTLLHMPEWILRA